ncbi:hypothetical protein ABZX30_35215 [Streptomyces sp. NPDC004542]|uniref:SCO2400 family protein n=1 Tax=Streptomyces sp. NPDC004542 TaxID=3154281 RepID=UPI0033ABEF62
MDYCHPCRRHLNGALACPGCGSPAGPIRAYAHQGAPASPYAYGPEEPYAGIPPTDEDFADGEGEEDAPDEGAAEDDTGDEPRGRAANRRRARGRGRGADAAESADPDASRRDRKAAAHRRRRRRTVLIAAGFALAAGGLSLAELGIDAPGFSSPDPAAAGGDSPASAPGRTVDPLDDTARGPGGTASPDASSSPSASKSAGAEEQASTSPDGKDTDQSRQPATPGAGTPGPTTPATTRPASTPTSTPTTSTPTPKPSPTQTCDRFLWWCT